MHSRTVFDCILGDGIEPESVKDLILNADHVHTDDDFEPEGLREIINEAPDWMGIRVIIETRWVSGGRD